MSIRADAIKLAIFFIVTVTVTVVLASVLGNYRFEAGRSYSALISNASGLKSGDDVKMQGVPVGKVGSVTLVGPDEVKVGFTVVDRIPLTTASKGAVRYKNLIGDRYLEFQTPPGGTALKGGAVIPASQMSAALDMDKVVNGFRPLLQGLDSTQMNRFTASIIEVFSGQTATVGELLAQLGQLTLTVADRSDAIDRVIANLNTVLAVADNRNHELDEAVDQLQQLVSALAADRQTITGSMVAIADASRTVRSLLSQTRPSITQDVEGVRMLAHNLNVDSDTLQTLLGGLPKTYQKIARAGGYGNFINFFLCGVAIHYPGPPGQSVTPMFTAPAARCQG